jgi:1,4-dihydroxy-2-naphthoate polyprenyltransferase
MPNAKAWLEAARPRTLPLALSCIGMGCFLAAAEDRLQPSVCVLACLTTILLQILSNLANDYGDAVNGKDTDARQGPQRAVQSGAIAAGTMLRAIVIFGILSLICGIVLLYIALKNADNQVFWVFLGIGLLAIVAAITYTAGKKPYGYEGFGDVSVLIFFGWVGVIGSYYLNTLNLRWDLLLPATACGLCAVAVLNINNIRDIESDTLTGKRSIPVRIGRPKAVIYHWCILAVAMLCMIVFGIMHQFNALRWLFLLSFVLFIRNGLAVSKLTNSKALDPYLKQMAVSTLLFVILFGIGVILQ